MSQAPNGNYFIVSKTAASDGKLLAVTYNGSGNVLTVTEFNNSDSQAWTLAPYDATTQTISPKNSSSLVVGTEGSDYTLKAISSTGRHNWYINGTLGIYTVEDVGNNNYWYIEEAVVEQDVAKGQKASARLSNWQLILV